MSWNGVKKQSNIEDIKYWCDEMGIQNYTINTKGEIDVNGDVDLRSRDFKELPYKFGKVTGDFEVKMNDNLTSLKNCPNFVGGFFTCRECSKLNSLEGCPSIVGKNFWCGDCKRKFTEEEITSLCKVRNNNIINTPSHI